MRIGIVSDTHGSVPYNLSNALSDCDAVIHAGDIGRQKVLDDIRSAAPTADLYPVLGNTDLSDAVPFDEEVPQSCAVVFDGVPFIIAHEPQNTDYELRCFLESSDSSGFNESVAVHGHTHTPNIVVNEAKGTITVCPGALSRPRNDWSRTVAKVDVENGYVLEVYIETLNGAVAWDWHR